MPDSNAFAWSFMDVGGFVVEDGERREFNSSEVAGNPSDLVQYLKEQTEDIDWSTVDSFEFGFEAELPAGNSSHLAYWDLGFVLLDVTDPSTPRVDINFSLIDAETPDSTDLNTLAITDSDWII